MLRHEQQSIRMALATVMHHSYKVHTENGAPRGQTTGTRAGVRTEFHAMSEDSDVVGGGRPPSLVDVWPQERVQQRTVEQIVDPVPSVPLLHDVVPRMVEQLVDILAPLDFRVAEQVIDVSKIVCPPRAAGTVLRAPETAEQLVEVLTEPAYSHCRAGHWVERCGDADREQSSSSGSAGRWRRSSRSSSRTGYSSSGHGADR